MQYFFTVLIILSVVSAIAQGNTAAVTDAILSSGTKAIDFTLSAGSAIIIYSGIMNIANKSGLCELLSKLLAPLLTKLFGPLEKQTLSDITMNISCNFLGLGNAATPYGLSAIKAMAQGECATNAMILFVVINTSSLQLIPTTLAAVRRSAGCVSPFDLLPAIWICSALSLISAIISCKICERVEKRIAKLHHSGTHTRRRSGGRGKEGQRI